MVIFTVAFFRDLLYGVTMIEYIKQDITTVNLGYVGHGVNCQGRMGSGIALAIKNKWPSVYDQYKERYESGQLKGEMAIGEIDIVPITNQLFVVNMYTQNKYGYDGKAYAYPEAIENCIALTMKHIKHETPTLPLYIPKIGCGLGGLKWENIEPIVNRLTQKYMGVSLYVCEL